MFEGLNLILPNQNDLIIDKEGICHALLQSLRDGNIIGVKSPLLGKGTFLISTNGLVMIKNRLNVIFNEFDCAGNPLKINTLLISEIESIYPFKSSVLD